RPVERALLSVIQQTYLAGASTRTIDALAETVGVPGTNPAAVEAQAHDWDRRVEAFAHRRLRHGYPYLMLFERTALVRTAGEAQPASIVVAVAIAESGDREVVSLAIRAPGLGGRPRPPAGPVLSSPSRGGFRPPRPRRRRSPLLLPPSDR